ncbi:phosphopantetheine-binding protein [Streptomyces sp. NPDC093093]
MNLDSLNMVEVRLQLDEEFDVNIDEEAAARMNSVQDVIDYIAARK